MFKAGVMGINSGTLESQKIAKEVINSQEVQNALGITGSIEKKISVMASVLDSEKKHMIKQFMKRIWRLMKLKLQHNGYLRK